MNRTELIQKILNKNNSDNYLEIGVDRGKNFFPIKANRKIAVDPNFEFSWRRKIKWSFKNSYNIRAKFYELTSDNFFAKIPSILFDVVFIDGLHTYQQSLRDVENSIKHLKENGVILLHDCNPPHEAAAYPADSFDHAKSLNHAGWNGGWCGDVWKTICYLRSCKRELKVCVIDIETGLGIITKGEPENFLDLSEQNIVDMTYPEFLENRNFLLNLKDESYISEFLETI